MAAPSVDDLARSFERYLRAGNKSPRTVETYLEALAGFSAHLAATSKRSLGQASREDVETWIALLLGRWKPSTAHNRYRAYMPSTAGSRRKRTSRVRWPR
jgi:site-specific recombinase XerD